MRWATTKYCKQEWEAMLSKMNQLGVAVVATSAKQNSNCHVPFEKIVQTAIETRAKNQNQAAKKKCELQ